MTRTLFLATLLALLTTSVALADAPTFVDLQRLYRTGDFAGTIKGCGDALAPGGATDPADRFKIAWLAGETQLKLKHAAEAVDAFNAAAKETENVRQAAIAKATAILIGRSKDFIYTSLTIKPPTIKAPPIRTPAVRTQPPQAPPTRPTSTLPAVVQPPVELPRGQFDILEPLHRTDAMAAMWTDEKADAEHTVKDKIALKSFPAITEALDRVNQAEPIAVATGNADWAQTQKDLLANGARLNSNMAMKDMNAQIIAIGQAQIKRRRGQHPKAMPQDQRDRLNQISQSLDAITVALKALPEQLGVDKDTFTAQTDQAARLQDRASTVLATD